MYILRSQRVSSLYDLVLSYRTTKGYFHQAVQRQKNARSQFHCWIWMGNAAAVLGNCSQLRLWRRPAMPMTPCTHLLAIGMIRLSTKQCSSNEKADTRLCSLTQASSSQTSITCQQSTCPCPNLPKPGIKRPVSHN